MAIKYDTTTMKEIAQKWSSLAKQSELNNSNIETCYKNLGLQGSVANTIMELYETYKQMYADYTLCLENISSILNTDADHLIAVENEINRKLKSMM